MPKKKVGSPPHGDKYRHLAALKPPFRSESAVLPPVQKAKAKQKPQRKQSEVPPPNDE